MNSNNSFDSLEELFIMDNSIEESIELEKLPYKKIKESNSIYNLDQFDIDSFDVFIPLELEPDSLYNNNNSYMHFLAIKLLLEKENHIPFKNDSNKFIDNNCFCCKNYLVIHELVQYKFIEKYNKNKSQFRTIHKINLFNLNLNSITDTEISTQIDDVFNQINLNPTPYPTPNPTPNPTPSSKYIKLLYRLKPDIFLNLNLSNYKYLESINFNYCKTQDNLKYIYEIYFYQPDISDYDYINCTICSKKYCPIHIILNEFYMKKCNYCIKYWNICAWCKNDHLINQFNSFDQIIDEDILCMCFHKS